MQKHHKHDKYGRNHQGEPRYEYKQYDKGPYPGGNQYDMNRPQSNFHSD